MLGLPMLAFSLTCYLASLGILIKRPGHTFSRLTAAFATFALTLLTVLYGISDYFTGNGITRAVIYHLQVGIEGAAIRDYTGLVAISALGLAIGAVSAIRLSRKSKHSARASGTGSQPHVTLLLTAAVGFHPAVTDLAALSLPTQELHAPPFSEVYKRPSLQNISSSPLNLVMIYLEGFERTYFDNDLFPGMATALKQLDTQGLTLTDIHQFEGTGWTIAGMVASQCGIPLEIPAGWETIFEAKTFLPKAICLGDILKEQGYHLTYLGGASLKFGKKGLFYQTHGFDEIYGQEQLASRLPDNTYQTSWGLYDDTMLDLAYEKYLSLLNTKKRFALLTLTVDTHMPKGHLSRSCLQRGFPPAGLEILDAVNCSDYLVSRFVERIRRTPGSEDTLIVLLSDHLSMRTNAWHKLSEGKRRIFYTALHPGIGKQRIYRRGSHFDLGPTTLSLMGLDVPALGLGRSLTTEEPTLRESLAQADASVISWLSDSAELW